MVILNVDHPDVEQFIWSKAIEERKARDLQNMGWDMSLDGKDSFSVQYQNANIPLESQMNLWKLLRLTKIGN